MTPTRSDLGELQRLFDTGRFLQVADYCKDRLGKTRYHEYLAETAPAHVDPHSRGTPAHLALALPAVVTTNYDSLLEDSLLLRDPTPAEGSDPRRQRRPGHAPLRPSLLHLKAHGDINRPATVVLTARDYREIIHQNPAFNSMFSALLMTNAVLFLGYSLGDPDLNLLS